MAIFRERTAAKREGWVRGGRISRTRTGAPRDGEGAFNVILWRVVPSPVVARPPRQLELGLAVRARASDPGRAAVGARIVLWYGVHVRTRFRK